MPLGNAWYTSLQHSQSARRSDMLCGCAAQFLAAQTALPEERQADRQASLPLSASLGSSAGICPSDPPTWRRSGSDASTASARVEDAASGSVCQVARRRTGSLGPAAAAGSVCQAATPRVASVTEPVALAGLYPSTEEPTRRLRRHCAALLAAAGRCSRPTWQKVCLSVLFRPFVRPEGRPLSVWGGIAFFKHSWGEQEIITWLTTSMDSKLGQISCRATYGECMVFS
jgi:hypothetical protein